MIKFVLPHFSIVGVVELFPCMHIFKCWHKTQNMFFITVVIIVISFAQHHHHSCFVTSYHSFKFLSLSRSLSIYVWRTHSTQFIFKNNNYNYLCILFTNHHRYYFIIIKLKWTPLEVPIIEYSGAFKMIAFMILQFFHSKSILNPIMYTCAHT